MVLPGSVETLQYSSHQHSVERKEGIMWIRENIVYFSTQVTGSCPAYAQADHNQLLGSTDLSKRLFLPHKATSKIAEATLVGSDDFQ